MEIRLIIAGGRDFSDYQLLQLETQRFLVELDFNPSKLIIVSGNAKGADSLGEDFAEKYNFPIATYPANWNLHGKAAGPIRNREMAEFGTHLIAFWDQKSSGTKNMIENAEKYKLIYKIVKY